MKTALITGASSGLGYEFAKIFASEKYKLEVFGIRLLPAKTSARVIRKWQESLEK